MALVILREPLPLEPPPLDGTPVTRLLFFIAPSPRAHLDLLGRLTRFVARGPLLALLEAGASDDQIFAAAAAADASGAAVRGSEAQT